MMEVEESDVLRSKGRTSRSNSNGSKDFKVEKTNMKETNGTEDNISGLPNGNEGPPISMIKTEDDSFEIEEHGIEEDASGNIIPVTRALSPMGRLEPPEKDNNSHSINKNVLSDGVIIKMEVDDPAGSSDDEFRGFEPQAGSYFADHDNAVFAKLCEKEEKHIAAYEAAISEEQRRDLFRSGTSSPMKIDGLTEVLGDGELCSSNASSPSVASGFSGELRSYRGKKSLHIDLSSPAFRKPLDMGWKRELVFRNMPDATQKRMADVYYYTPSGKKVRSAREVLEHLPGTDLTDENFTFFKMALGINDPTKEIIRDAKRGAFKEGIGTPPHKVPKVAKSPKPDGMKAAGMSPSDSVGLPKQQKFARGTFPRIKMTNPGAQSSPGRSKTPGRSKKDPSAEGELEMGMLPPSWKEPSAVSGAHKTTQSPAPGALWAGAALKSVASASTVVQKKGPSQQPCSIRCINMMGVIPSLQCRVCLCLYHPECVGLGPLTDTIHSYVCKKCQQEVKDGRAGAAASASKLVEVSKPLAPPPGQPPPPLTPIASLGGGEAAAAAASVSSTSAATGSPPKLQRLPRVEGPKLYTIPRYVKVAAAGARGPRDKIPNIVGAVTTWLPPSSTIQLGGGAMGVAGSPGGSPSPHASGAASPASSDLIGSPASPPPTHVQSVAHVAGKKYIVVPRHSVLSVTSAVAKVADPAPERGNIVSSSTPTAASGSPPLPPPPPPAVVPADVALPGKFILGTGSGPQSGLLLVPVGSPHANMAMAAAQAMPQVDSPQYVLVNAQTAGLVFSNIGRTREGGPTGMGPGTLFMQNLSAGYLSLVHVFEYLKVHELLRAARVNQMWRDLAGHESLWRTVRMKNSQVLDWDGCAATLSKRGTRHLDLRKMLLDQSKSKEIWAQFCEAIGRIASLRHLDLCRCPASVVERVAAQCPQLTNLIALFLTDSHIDLNALASLSHLEEVRLKGLNGLKLKSSLEVLTTMTTLRHLSLTTIKEFGKSKPEILQSLTQLESLELGECSDFSEAFGTECLPRLTNLTRLRLEMGQGKCPTFIILSGVKSLPSLIHLELVNFDIKPGFDQALAQCINIKRLLLIPTYLTQSATTNHMVLGGVTKLSRCLRQFVWGVTHELLHVTELFKDQCEGQKGGAPKGVPNASGTGMNPPPATGKKNSPGDSIPILRPVPGMEGLGPASEIKTEENESPKPSPQVDILPLSQIQKILVSQLPGAKVSILKIPFHATWRQTLADH